MANVAFTNVKSDSERFSMAETLINQGWINQIKTCLSVHLFSFSCSSVFFFFDNLTLRSSDDHQRLGGSTRIFGLKTHKHSLMNTQLTF